ncbi:MAG: hypothetical protein M1822_006346 [Bathelium mastoideum]|nr:MAG: hypothetical protein M1822_006346 [Bathelium mastoideum]
MDRPTRTDSGYASHRIRSGPEANNVDPHFTTSELTSSHGRHPAIKRTQRQDNMRLQTEASHLREISSLVQRMVATQEQCSLCGSESSASEHSITPSESEDDVASIASPKHEAPSRRHNLPYRRSTEVLKGRPGVNKDVRMRKSRSRMNMNANGARRT